jgi:glycine hydroxymethyltransferase
LIASENFASHATISAISSHFTNKYAEGYPNARYYGGNQNTDQLEILCQQRALAAFKLNPAKWGVNVQALSGSAANLAVYTALIPPGGRIMGLALADGGHLTHGFRSGFNTVSASSKFWQSLPYRVNAKTSLIDLRSLEQNAKLFNPHMLVAGASAYPRHIDYAGIKKIANSVGAYLMSDMAHVAGLVAAGIGPSPFDHCDIVTTTTHKTLRSVRGSLIFFRRGNRKVGKKLVKYDLEQKINSAVFPGLQGGPHMHQIAAIAVSLKEAASPEFREYQQNVVKNMRALAEFLMANGIKLVTNGTDNHLAVLDLRNTGLDGARVEAVLDAANITTNKNTIPGDRKAGSPAGLRIGSPALTTRGLGAKDFEQVGKFIVQGIEIGKGINKKTAKSLAKFKTAVKGSSDVAGLKKSVVQFATQFPLPGVFDPAAYQ